MLVQFMFKNVLSFKEETVLDMTAVNAYKEHSCNLIDSSEDEKLLRVAAIYGANASGKSNLYTAMQYFQNIIAESFNNNNVDGKSALERYYEPFRLDSDVKNSEYQIIKIINGFEYKYGFEFNDFEIVSEWMYRKNLKTKRESIILERAGSAVKLGASVRKECEMYKEQIPMETLALSFFNRLKLETDIFRELYEAIRYMMIVPPDFYGDKEVLMKFLPGVIEQEGDKLTEFLMAIDTGIKGIRYEKNENTLYFYTMHRGKDGNSYELPLWKESEGTIRSILIYINARTAVLYDSFLFVDELNIKLHPLLLKFIIDLFYDKDSHAQLVYTTHDTTLLDKKFFRRDQIWFVQKDEFGYSELTALSDFKVRSDASFEKDYLAGVYGGIPLIREFTLREGD